MWSYVEKKITEEGLCKQRKRIKWVTYYKLYIGGCVEKFSAWATSQNLTKMIKYKYFRENALDWTKKFSEPFHTSCT